MMMINLSINRKVLPQEHHLINIKAELWKNISKKEVKMEILLNNNNKM